MKKLKIISVYHETDCEDIPENGKQFIEFFQDLLEKVPVEFKDSAEISIEAVEDYGDIEMNVQVYYIRPETNKEYDIRIKDQQNRIAFREKADKLTLKRLQEKYPEAL